MTRTINVSVMTASLLTQNRQTMMTRMLHAAVDASKHEQRDGKGSVTDD